MLGLLTAFAVASGHHRRDRLSLLHHQPYLLPLAASGPPAVSALSNRFLQFLDKNALARVGCAGTNYPFLTLKERDIETGLDYFLARYYASTQGRFSSVDPIHFQADMIDDPQRFNLYAYVRNNPLKFIDPEGEAIELSGDEDERGRQLQALKDAVKEAGEYLYEAKGDDGKYYVAIYTNGPSGKGPKFEEMNDVAGEFHAIITDKQVVTIDFDSGTVTDDYGHSETLSRTTRWGGNAAVTGYFKGQLMIKMLDPAKKDLGYLPGSVMSDKQDNMLTPSVTLAHELGHARYRMTGYRQRGSKDAERGRLTFWKIKCVSYSIRTGPTRKYHDPPKVEVSLEISPR